MKDKVPTLKDFENPQREEPIFIDEIPDVEVTDVPDTVEDPEPEQSPHPSDPEELRKSFSPSEINELKKRIQVEDLTDDNDLWEKYKKEKISQIRAKSVVLADVFIFCKDLIDSIASKYDDPLINKLQIYISRFDRFEELRELVEEYGEGDKYNDHLYAYEIKEKLNGHKKEVINFVNFILQITMQEEDPFAEGSDLMDMEVEEIETEDVKEEVVEEENDDEEEHDPDKEDY